MSCAHRNVLRGFDDDMREGMRAAMARAGVVHRFGILPARIDKRPDGALRVMLANGEMIDADQVLVATGRYAQYRGAWPGERRDWSSAGTARSRSTRI